MRTPAVTLEPASDDDASELAELRVLAMRESLERVGRFDALRARERFLSGYSPAHTRHVCCDGRRAGFVVVRPDEDGLLLEHLYVTPDAQGQGIGAAVLARIFGEADRQGKSLRVGALKESDSNRFYERHGFALVEVGEWEITMFAPRGGGALVIEGRVLARDEIATMWRIDRTELVEAAYRLVDGALVLERVHFDMKGWPPGEAEKYTPLLEVAFDRGGWFYGLFDGAKPVGFAALDGRFIGRPADRLQLASLHVSHRYRDKGLGGRLFMLAADEARKRGAKTLYISATPSKHTIDFYTRLGCKLAREPDPELFALEPEDIHLEFDLRRVATRMAVSK